MSVRFSAPSPLVLALFSVLGLAACAAPPQAKVTSPSAITPASYAPPPVSVAPSSPGATTPTAPSLADLASGPQHFEGLEGKMVLAALGDPSFRRRERPAEVWQYYGPGCILDLFLYDEAPAASGKPVEGLTPDGKVAHAELRGREDAPAPAGCLSRLIDQRHNQRAG